MPPDPLSTIVGYHDRTKHHFQRYARSLGYLDWASQPHPFRYYEGSEEIALDPHRTPGEIPYEELYAAGAERPARVVDRDSLGDFLRHSMAITAWKQAGESRWALRANPSSGNLHPTECYLALDGPAIGAAPGVYHYLSKTHVLERRGEFPAGLWPRLLEGQPAGSFLIGLSSILWREAWKYGERAFRYCQHDTGHALAALSLSARLCGWQLRLVTTWSTDEIGALGGLDRASEFSPDEPEEPELLAVVSPGEAGPPLAPLGEENLASVRGSRWFGRANLLSEEHAPWPVIDVAADVTQFPADARWHSDPPKETARIELPPLPTQLDAHRIILQRRSAVDFDGKSRISREKFARLLARTLPAGNAPWKALPWSPAIDLAMFVHRVDDVEPGLYLLLRDPARLERLKAAMRPDFEWALAPGLPAGLPLYRLRAGDFGTIARQLSCHQEIAGDGFFSLGMLADFAEPLARHGAWFYRALFWEAGAVGQVLYLEAEANGVRATGIGCYFDDPVHELLGLAGHGWQSLYHFTVGVAVDDARLQTWPAYGPKALR